MSAGQPTGVVLVTGVSRYLGAQVALRLAGDPRISHVIGLDGTPPADPLPGVEFVQADLRTPEPGRVIVSQRVDTVVHLAVSSVPDQQAGGRSAQKEQNVIGTMQLLAGCQRAPLLRKIVFRSSTAAYGASFRDPAVFTEDTEARDRPRGGYARDVLDIEEYVRGFRRRRPDVLATVLRLAPLIGSQAYTSLTRYFAQPLVPTVLGRDPRLQFVHVDDALEILNRSIVEDHPGTFNVAGPGVITLSQAVRRAGRIPVPVPEPGMSALAAMAKGAGRGNYTLDQLDLFVHGRVVDTTRLVKEFGYEPRPTRVAFADFLSGTGAGGMVSAETVRLAEHTILDQIRRVRAALGASRD